MPPHSTMTSPVFSPQLLAGEPPSVSFTTTMPRENSLIPTVCPTGTSIRGFTSTAPARKLPHSARAMQRAAAHRPRRPIFCENSYKKITPL